MEMSYANFFKRYGWVYAGWLLGAMIVLGVVSHFLNLENSSLGLLLVIVCAYMPGNRFYEDHKRLPSKQEKRAFSAIALGINMVLNLSLIGLSQLLFHLADSLDGSASSESVIPSLPATWWIGITIVVCALTYFLAGWGFTTGAKAAFKAEGKKAKKGV